MRRHTAAVAAAVLLWSAPSSPPTPPAVGTPPTSDAPAVGRGSPDLAFPGGGAILYQPASGPGYERRGVGIVRSDGTTITRSMQNALPYWDPAGPGRSSSSATTPGRVSQCSGPTTNG